MTLDAVAVETDSGLHYSWRDLDEATAMVANLFGFSGPGTAGTRVAVQVDKSVEALGACIWPRCGQGLVYLPLNTAYQSAEMDYFISDAKPAVLVCAGRNFGWLSKMAFSGRHAVCVFAQ